MQIDLAAMLPALVGGALIGTSASLLLALNGRVAGVSGILGELLVLPTRDSAWRAWFLGGLLLGGVLLRIFEPDAFGAATTPWFLIAAAGILVGFGTRLGSGCTSGHGVCGMSRLSPRSFAATLTFMLTGGLATYAMRHLFSVSGGGP